VTRRLGLLLAVLAASAFAQEQDVQRELIQRQQQSDAFLLQLRQSQEAARLPPGDLKARQELESRQAGERRRLDAVSERQLREIKADTPQELRPVERQRAADERAPLTIPSGGIVQPVEDPR
jgi:hypothetical protein